LRHLEDAEQAALFRWAAWAPMPTAPDVFPGSKVADYLFAIPNGGKRDAREAARMKLQGVKAGVSDVLLPVKRGGSGGLWIELKAPGGGRTSEAQKEWLVRMRYAGHRAIVCPGWLSAKATIEWYLMLPNVVAIDAAPVAPMESAL